MGKRVASGTPGRPGSLGLTLRPGTLSSPVQGQVPKMVVSPPSPSGSAGSQVGGGVCCLEQGSPGE